MSEKEKIPATRVTGMRVWRGSAKKWTAMSGQFNCPVMKERSSTPLCHKDTAFIPYIHARVLCFLAYYRNKKCNMPKISMLHVSFLDSKPFEPVLFSGFYFILN